MHATLPCRFYHGRLLPLASTQRKAYLGDQAKARKESSLDEMPWLLVDTCANNKAQKGKTMSLRLRKLDEKKAGFSWDISLFTLHVSLPSLLSLTPIGTYHLPFWGILLYRAWIRLVAAQLNGTGTRIGISRE